MKRFILWMLVLLFATAAALPCGATTSVYLVYDQWGGTWHDANKTAANTEDDLMCWAAAASNVLAWGHWGTPAYNTDAQIFTQFQNHWTDNGGYSWWGYRWWMNGSTPPTGSASHIDVPGGGNFYPQLNFSNYYAGSSTGNLLSGIDGLMHQGYGVTLNITNGGAMLHAITAWGFEYDNSGGSVVYRGVYVTDSDDNRTALVEYPLIWQSDRWYLGGGYAGWRISSFAALQMYQTPLTPSWVLLGTGLAALLGTRRRRRRGRGA
jgi:hypothetical protein